MHGDEANHTSPARRLPRLDSAEPVACHFSMDDEEVTDDEVKKLWRRVKAASARLGLGWDYHEICQFIAVVTDLPFRKVYKTCIDEE